MKKFKRILPFVLAIMLVFGSFGSVFAVMDPLVEAFGDGVFSLTAAKGNQFVDLVMLFKGVTDKSGLATAYDNSFGQLTTTRLEDFGLTIGALNEFATYIDGQTFSEAALRSYINNANRVTGRADFDAALADREVAFATALSTAGLDVTKMNTGFDNMDELFGIIKVMDILKLKIYDAPYNHSSLTVNSTTLAAFIEAANAILSDDVSFNSANTALTSFTGFYNSASAGDKAVIMAYLIDNGFVTVAAAPPSGGSDSGTVTPPEPEVPTQDEINEAAAVQVPATVTQSGDDVYVTSTVTEALVNDALQAAKDAVAEMAPTTPADTKAAQTIIVLEVPPQTGAPATNVEVNVPLVPLQDAEKDGADAILIKTELGQVTFDIESLLPDSAEVAADDKIVLEIKKVDQAALANTDVPAGALVLDFTLKINDEKITEFYKPIKVAVPYTLKPGENPEQITVYFLNDEGVSAPVGGRYNSETGMVEFYTEHFSKYYAVIASK